MTIRLLSFYPSFVVEGFFYIIRVIFTLINCSWRLFYLSVLHFITKWPHTFCLDIKINSYTDTRKNYYLSIWSWMSYKRGGGVRTQSETGLTLVCVLGLSPLVQISSRTEKKNKLPNMEIAQILKFIAYMGLGELYPETLRQKWKLGGKIRVSLDGCSCGFKLNFTI